MRHVIEPKSYPEMTPEYCRRLLVAALQLPRLSPEDRAALRKFVERDMEAGR